jgi:hypothetical protein
MKKRITKMKRNGFVVLNEYGVGVVRLYLAAVLVFAANSAYCNEVVKLSMTGIEIIDPNEPISGEGVVGVTLNKNKSEYEKDKNEYDLKAVYVYFTNIPSGPLQATLTTVDGRYNFSATPKCPHKDLAESTKWAHLELKKEESEPLDVGFLERYFSDEDLGGIAILVTDDLGTIYPVLWGKPEMSEDLDLEIRVNAEGADAFYVRFEDKDKEIGRPIQCEEASKRSGFKFDQYCRMAWKDAKKLGRTNDGKVPIIRKRGATYEPSIFVKIMPAAEDREQFCEVKGQNQTL